MIILLRCFDHRLCRGACLLNFLKLRQYQWNKLHANGEWTAPKDTK